MARLPFLDRAAAGQQLGTELVRRKIPNDAIVLALPRGGVVVGRAVADILRASLDIVVVRKLGVPWQPELAMGAIAGTVRVLDEELIREAGISPEEIEAATARERTEMERRERLYRAGRAAPDLEGRTVLLVDDGLATDWTMMVAARHVCSLNPNRVIIAVPVASPAACEWLTTQVDSCVCLASPEPFRAVGEWYLRGKKLRAVQRLIAMRSARKRGTGRVNRKLTSNALAKQYERYTYQQRALVRRAAIVRDRLVVLTAALKRLLGDRNFVELLRENQLDTVPEQLASRLC